MVKYLCPALIACGLATATESFESLNPGAFTSASVEGGTLTAAEGNAEILGNHARTGSKALRIMGGENKAVTLELAKPTEKDTPCQFWAERWTGKAPFDFKVIALVGSEEKELLKNDNLGTGSYKLQGKVTLPTGTKALKFVATTEASGGVIIDDINVSSGPMVINDVKVTNPGVYPLLKHAAVNPAVGLHVTASGSDAAPETTVSFNLSDPTAIEEVRILSGNDNGTNFRNATVFGSGKPAEDGSVTIKFDKPLEGGESHLWIDAQPSEGAPVGGLISFKDITVKAGDKSFTGSDTITQRIGYLVSVPGCNVGNQADGAEPRKCVAFRIPGMIRTKKGTLIGVFDARYKHSGDLCADIDVASVRSTDGGQTWSGPEVAMDAGPGDDNGCGDPCILQDKRGRIWLQSLVCHFKGGASLGVSGKGFDEKKTGQWCMTYSDDDGKTWSKEFVNPTRQIKEAKWTTILAGPGNGICTRKGAIVFPAQIWERGANPRCQSTICYSKDGGKNWVYGKGLPTNTSECQVVELRNGAIMINARNENRSGKRIIYTTKDMGETWEAHATNNSALQEPTCQASIIRAKAKGYGDLLLFSNPKSGKRDTMTIRYSKDDGATWSDGYLYDTRGCWGYSCLALIDDKTVGVLYESPHVSTDSDMHGMGFLRIPLESIITGKDLPAGPNKDKKDKKKKSKK